jgi:threonine/homoserine/homoserine lactone efflux protein
MAGFLAGIAAILANPKAILFYMGMLPGFFDLTRVTALDIAAIAAISTLVPLIGNTGFAILVDTARRRFSSPERLARINRIRIRRGFHQGSQGPGGRAQAAGHVYRRHR